MLAAVLTAGCSGNPAEIASAGGTGAASGLSTETTETGATAASGPINPFADPTAAAPGGREIIAEPTVADVMQTGTLAEMALGRPDAPITLVQYASLTCPHCRHFHETVYPQLKREFIDTGKIRYILREFPIGKQSGNATIALRCAPPAKYFDLYGRFMTQQAHWVSQEVRLDPIFDIAKQVGMKRAEFDACLQNQGMIDGLKWVKERGRKLGIIGTPNFFVGKTLIKKELTIEEIRAFVASGGAVATAAPPSAN